MKLEKHAHISLLQLSLSYINVYTTVINRSIEMSWEWKPTQRQEVCEWRR